VEPEPQQVTQQQAAAADIVEPAAQAAAAPRMEPGDLIDSLSREIKRASDWDRVVYPLLSDIKYQGEFLMKDGGPLRRLKWPSLQKVLRTAYLLIRGGKWDIDALKDHEWRRSHRCADRASRSAPHPPR
jgi:hypothetical protein